MTRQAGSPINAGGSPDSGYRVSIRTVLGDWPALLLWLLVFLAGAVAYPHLPEQVPSHWNVQGQIDAYSSRTWAVVFLPLITAGLYLLMLVVPLIDPRRANYTAFAGSYRTIRLSLVTLMAGIQAMVLLTATGHPLRVDLFVPAGVSLMFMVLGNVMGQIRHNYFVGIRTPWTLASETVWRKTHRMGGYAFVAAGLAGLAGLFFPPLARMIIFISATTGAAILSIVYSYRAYRQEEHNR